MLSCESDVCHFWSSKLCSSSTKHGLLQDVRFPFNFETSYFNAGGQEQNVYLGVNCDVVVSFVRRSTNISAHTLIYQGYPTTRNAIKRVRLSNRGEYEENLGDVHMNSSRLRRCSKYFDACLSERWVGAGIIPSTMPVHLTLDVYTDVQYYRDCFSRMYFSKYKQIPNVNHCLKLLQVASQISYLELVEDCVRYLTSIPWSPLEEEGIRQFANSTFYPSDCAADLSARLGLALTNTERHSLLLNIMERALCQCFDDVLKYGLDDDIDCCEQLFSNGFRLIVAGSCHTLVENVLQHVNDRVEKLILEAKEHPESTDLIYYVDWTLSLLLETGSATELVEYIVDKSPLCEMLETTSSLCPSDWIFCIFVLFHEVVEGHLLLKTSTRYKLIKEWTWVLLLKNYENFVELQESEIYKTLSTFVMTFPYETQKDIISNWVAYYTGPFQEEQNLHIMKIQEDWFASLGKKISSLEP